MTPPDDHTLHALVSGWVQGVGFRFFVVRQARELGLTGKVRNLPDGRVEVWACGPRPRLLALEKALRVGPTFGRVDDLNVHWDEPMAPMDDFLVDL